MGPNGTAGPLDRTLPSDRADRRSAVRVLPNFLTLSSLVIWLLKCFMKHPAKTGLSRE